MRIFLVSALTFAVYLGPAAAQDRPEPSTPPPPDPVQRELSERGVDYVVNSDREAQQDRRGRRHALNAQRMMQQRMRPDDAAPEGEDAPSNELPINEEVIVQPPQADPPDTEDTEADPPENR